MDDTLVDKVNFKDDIREKRKIASLLLYRYEIGTTDAAGTITYNNNNTNSSAAFSDLATCWILKSYYLSTYQTLRIYADKTDPDYTPLLHTLNEMYTDVQEVIKRINAIYGTTYSLDAVDLTNPTALKSA